MSLFFQLSKLIFGVLPVIFVNCSFSELLRQGLAFNNVGVFFHMLYGWAANATFCFVFVLFFLTQQVITVWVLSVNFSIKIRTPQNMERRHTWNKFVLDTNASKNDTLEVNLCELVIFIGVKTMLYISRLNIFRDDHAKTLTR